MDKVQNKLKFGKITLHDLDAPAPGKRSTYYDIEIPKLAIRITSAGTKTFFVVKRAGKVMAWLRLGTFPDMSVEKARKEAQKVLGEFAHGTNPAEARRSFKKELTLTEFFTEYGERHGSKKRAWKDDLQRFRDYLQSPLGKIKLSAIKRPDVALILSDAEKAGKSVATTRNIRALASGIFAKAIEWGHLETNPAQGVKVAGAKVMRDRFLQPEELPRFFASLADEPSEAMRDFILLALLTGARKENVCSMHWNEINLDSAVWRIPRTKNGEPQSVTLCPEAIKILEVREGATALGFVFPGSGKTGHIVEPRKAVERVMARADIPFGRNVENGVTLHDLRRTLGSWQARTGASMLVIGKSLNHKSHQATAIYARLDLDPVRQSVNTAAAAMMEAGGLKDKANIRPIRRGSR